jgi:hypothetical protein
MRLLEELEELLQGRRQFPTFPVDGQPFPSRLQSEKH